MQVHTSNPNYSRGRKRGRKCETLSETLKAKGPRVKSSGKELA
jgi:hypothetical protein